MALQTEVSLDRFTPYELFAAFLLRELPALSVYRIYDHSSAGQHGRYSTLKRALGFVHDDAKLNLEFGVWNGASINLCASKHPDWSFYGFDSFQEDGRVDWKDDFSVSAPPSVPHNCTLIAGYFQQTLPKIQRTKGPSA